MFTKQVLNMVGEFDSTPFAGDAEFAERYLAYRFPSLILLVSLTSLFFFVLHLKSSSFPCLIGFVLKIWVHV